MVNRGKEENFFLYPIFDTLKRLSMSKILKKPLFILLLLLIIPVIPALIYPMASDDFELETDDYALDLKLEFLQNSSQKPDKTQSNIILITVDDLGMADCSIYDEGNIFTPNIERLGTEGIIFDNAYVTSPVCAPSRAAMITGRYQHRFGFEFTMHERYLKNQLEYLAFRYLINSEPWVAKWTSSVPDAEAIHYQGLPLSEITLAEILKKHGYHTGIMGKWHLGWSSAKQPAAFGFDEQYGFFNSHSLYSPEGTGGIVDQKIDADWTDSYIWSGQRNGPHAIYRNGIEIEERGYLTDRITEESIAYMDARKGDPFFLWISYSAPHTPLQAPKEYVDQFSDIKDPVKRVYRAMIANLDDNIGRLLNYLTANKLVDNSIIFFISDNGGAEYTHTTDNGRYEGGKNTEFEGGVKVPMIIRFPGKMAAGSRFSHMVSSMDIFTTSIASAGIEMMPGRQLDGVNLMPYILGENNMPPHEYLFWQRGNSKVVRNNEYKLVMNDYSGDEILYNLVQNKYENPDVASDNPEIVTELKEAFQDWSQSNKAPMWPSVIYFTAEKDGVRYYFEQ
jgi:arylsulfatase A-like enzyme